MDNETLKEKKRIYAKEYYHRHRERLLAERKARRAANLAEAHEKERLYRQQNADKVKGWQVSYWQRKLEQLQQNDK